MWIIFAQMSLLRIWTFIVIAAGTLLFPACGDESSSDALSDYELQLDADTTGNVHPVDYILTKNTLKVIDHAKTDTLVFAFPESDTTILISRLDVRARDCEEQHALRGFIITFSRGDSTLNVDPNVNHPKELDYAIRLINSLVKEQYQLHFTDMQPAVEPRDKMVI